MNNDMRKFFVIQRTDTGKYLSKKESGEFTPTLDKAMVTTHAKCARIIRNYQETSFYEDLNIVQLSDEEAAPFLVKPTPKGWGGVREGQGRKKRAETRGFHVRLRVDVLDVLAQVENKAVYIENALIAKFKEDGII